MRRVKTWTSDPCRDGFTTFFSLCVCLSALHRGPATVAKAAVAGGGPWKDREHGGNLGGERARKEVLFKKNKIIILIRISLLYNVVLVSCCTAK